MLGLLAMSLGAGTKDTHQLSNELLHSPEPARRDELGALSCR